MSEVQCNSNSECSSGSPQLNAPEVESEMHVSSDGMNVVWVGNCVCHKGSTFKYDTYASLKVHTPQD